MNSEPNQKSCVSLVHRCLAVGLLAIPSGIGFDHFMQADHERFGAMACEQLRGAVLENATAIGAIPSILCMASLLLLAVVATEGVAFLLARAYQQR